MQIGARPCFTYTSWRLRPVNVYYTVSVAGRGQVVLDKMLNCCRILLLALSPVYRLTFLRSDGLQKCQTKSHYVRWGRIDDLYNDSLALQGIKLR